MRLDLFVAILASALAVGACGGGSDGASPAPARKTIVVTYSVLGAVVRDLVGDAANVVVLMPNGADPHEWEPSAKDIETVTRADLLVENGLGLEGGMANAFAQAAQAGVRRFVASDHVTVRTVGAGEGAGTPGPDQALGALDPHLWMDPLTVKQAIDALAPALETELGIDVGGQLASVDGRLDALDAQLRTILQVVPEARRRLVTGHESLGYFAARYGFTLVGAVIPSLTTEAEPSAADLAALAEKIRAAGVGAIFTELGTPPQVAQAIGRETGARVVELPTHTLPDDGSYDTFMKQIATLVADNLR
jgi:zinc/manganese transport system substrate-binding protein